MPSEFILTLHDFKEGRTTAQFFPSYEAAREHGTKVQAAFGTYDFYVSTITHRSYGCRQC